MAAVSIIIPAYNCSHELGGLLDDIDRSALTRREVIVVDDGSTDDTAAVAASRPGVEVVRQDRNRGPAAARNLGAVHARHEIIIFIDSDVRLPPDRDVLQEMAAAFVRAPEVDCVCTASAAQPLRKNAIAYNNSIYHAYYMERTLAGHDERKDRIMFFSTRLGAVRATRFRASGGFLESLEGVMNEDGEFGTRCYHLGFVTYLNRRLVNLHRYPTDFRRFARSYFHAAHVQAQIAGRFDTSADETTSASERGRRLLAATASLLPAPFLLFGPAVGVAVLIAWTAAMALAFRHMGALIRAHVPPRYWTGFFGVYILITPVILLGYGLGTLQHLRGRSRLVYPPSSLPYFQQSEAHSER